MSGIVDYYARPVDEYDDVYLKPERQGDLRILESRLPEFFADRDVLEVAAGTGYWTRFIASRALCVLATDINEPVLSVARKRFSGFPNVRTALADAYALEGIEAGFSGAFVGFWWSHIPRSRLAGFLDNLLTKLAPAARIVIVDNRYVEGSSTPIHRTDRDGNMYQLRKLKDGSEHEVLKNFSSPEEIRRVLGAVGNDVDVRLLNYYWLASFELP